MFKAKKYTVIIIRRKIKTKTIRVKKRNHFKLRYFSKISLKQNFESINQINTTFITENKHYLLFNILFFSEHIMQNHEKPKDFIRFNEFRNEIETLMLPVYAVLDIKHSQLYFVYSAIKNLFTT